MKELAKADGLPGGTHNQEMCTVPNTVDVTRWGGAYTRFTEAVHMVAGPRRRFWASESDDPRSHFVFHKISSDFVGTRIVRIWGLHRKSPPCEVLKMGALTAGGRAWRTCGFGRDQEYYHVG